MQPPYTQNQLDEDIIIAKVSSMYVVVTVVGWSCLVILLKGLFLHNVCDSTRMVPITLYLLTSHSVTGTTTCTMSMHRFKIFGWILLALLTGSRDCYAILCHFFRPPKNESKRSVYASSSLVLFDKSSTVSKCTEGNVNSALPFSTKGGQAFVEILQWSL